MTAPAVSIVLPVYNGRRYLRESMDSLLGQTDPDFELIAWDDGSADDSREILAQYRDPRLRVFANPVNAGLFPTLNLGLQEARGALVRFWTQDDRMKRDCLAREREFWTRRPQIAMSYCQW